MAGELRTVKGDHQQLREMALGWKEKARGKIAQLEATVKAKEQEVSKLRQTLGQRDKELEALRQSKAEELPAESRQRMLSQQAKQASTILHLQNELQQLKNTSSSDERVRVLEAERVQTKEALRKAMEVLRSPASGLQAQVARLEAERTEQAKQIAELTEQNRRLSYQLSIK